LDSYTCAFCTSGQEESIHHICAAMLGNSWTAYITKWWHNSEHPGFEDSAKISVLHDSNHPDELDDLESKK
jgi:hypothetical protein